MPANSIIQIKRSQSTATPTSLANGELAYSFSSNKLFIGQTNNAADSVTVEYIGGKLLVDKVANLEAIFQPGSADLYAANLEVDGVLKFASGKYTNNGVMFTKADGIVDFVTGSSGKILQIAANGTPVFDDLSGGTY